MAMVVAVSPFDVDLPAGGWTALHLRPLLLGSALVAVAVVGRDAVGKRADRGRRARRGLVDRRLPIAAAALPAALALSAATSADPATGFAVTTRAAVLGLLFLAATVAFRQRRDLDVLLIGAAVGAVVAVAVGAAVLVRGADGWGSSLLVGTISTTGGVERLTRPFSHANVAAMYLTPVGVLLAGAATVAGSVGAARRWTIAAAVAAVGVSLTMSRAGLLAMAVGLAAVPLALAGPWPGLRPGSIRRRSVLVAGVTLAGLVGPLRWWGRWVDRLAPADGAAPRPPDRLEIWGQAIEAFGSAPLLGVGPGRFGVASVERTPDGVAPVIHAHQPLLELLSTGGLVAAGAGLALIATIAVVVRGGGAPAPGRELALILGPPLLVVALQAAVDHPFPFSSAGNLIAVVAGAAVGVRLGPVPPDGGRGWGGDGAGARPVAVAAIEHRS